MKAYLFEAGLIELVKQQQVLQGKIMQWIK